MITDLPYFTHENDARTNPKMEALRSRYGWAGYGQFWALNEEIAHSKDARLDISKKINRLSTAGKIGMNAEQFDEFIAFITDPEIDLANLVEGVLTTDQTQEDLAHFRAKQAKNRAQYHSKKDSAAENEDSAAEKQDSVGLTSIERASERLEFKELASGGAEVVDNSPKNPDEEARLYAFCLVRAKTSKGVSRPAAYAKSLMGKDDVLADWRESERKAEADRYLRYPDPPPCDCGGHIKADRHEGDGQCVECGQWYVYDEGFKSWAKSQGSGLEDTG